MSFQTTPWGIDNGVSIFSFNFWTPHFLICVECKPEKRKKQILRLNYVSDYKFLWTK